MYRVALIQNESEMMRYSWADIRPMVTALGYPFDCYTAENLDEFFARLDRGRYDAVLVASNACNDKNVLERLSENVDKVLAFLEKGNGIFISFQMKLACGDPYPILPEGLRVFAKNRIELGERPESGEIGMGREQQKHVLLNFPHRIDLEKVRTHCLSNDMVRGLYWTFLGAEEPDKYVAVLEDASVMPPRPLLLASRSDTRFRAVITSLPLDWQMHDELWENVARFVVEGTPTVAVVSKEGESTFDYRFLVSTLEVKKLPFAEYTLAEMVPDQVAMDIHRSFVLDPAWSEEEVDRFMARMSPAVRSGRARVFSFSGARAEFPLLEAASNVREYQGIADNALTWLVSCFPKDSEQGYWAGSFWCTVDVLRTLVLFDMPVEQYRDPILKSVYRHDQDGSYDEVLGATCAMLEVYMLFLGLEHERTQRCLKWIEERVHGKTLFERATGYDILTSLRIPLDPPCVSAFRDDVMDLDVPDNEFQIYRYAKTLQTCGYSREAKDLVTKLIPLQDPETGKWVNVPHTASVVDLLISIQEGIEDPSPDLDEMIFGGVQFLRSTYTPSESSWGGDIAATAKSLKALRSFEQRMSYPVDVVISALQTSHQEALQSSAIDVAISMNVTLQTQVNELHQRVEQLQGEVRRRSQEARFAARLSAWLASFGTALLVLSLFSILYAIRNDLWGAIGKHVGGFMKEFGAFAIPTLIVALMWVLWYVLKKLDLLPRFIEELLERSLRKKNEQ